MRFLLGLITLFFSAHVLMAEISKPNIVVIFADDLGYADIGPFGATKQKTPNLDRMAAEGLKLTSFYAAPVCSVSRAQLLTGCYGARVSVPGVFFPAGPQGLNPKEMTIAEHLKPLGYTTQMIGKWHLGDQPEFLPTKQGFDHYLGIPYSNDMQKKAKETGERVVPLIRDDKVEELLNDEKQSTIVERYTKEAVSFIQKHQDKPFFLYMPHNAVHTPIFPGERFRGKSANGRFGDWVEELDWSVGQVMDTLRQLKLTEKTLVVFTSDNGPWLIRKSDGGSALPLRGGKGSTWEGGVRVPTVAWWPGQIKPKTTCDAVTGTIDLLPTAVALAGGKLPPEPVIDGRDLSPILFGKSQESPREAHYYFSGYSVQAVRQGAWKLALSKQPEPHLEANAGEDANTNPRLYNLDNDIGETKNLAAMHPDIVTKLTALATTMNNEIGGMNPKARRPAGTVAKPVTLYPTVEEPKKKAPAKPAELRNLKVGDAVSAEAAPHVGGQPFKVTCTITTDQPDAIIVAHGGKTLGYALHLKNGHVVFSVRTDTNSLIEIQSGKIQGSTTITASITADGNITLKAGEQQMVQRQGMLIPRQPQEDFCVGHDNGQPITTYSSSKSFAGKITDLNIHVGK